MGQEAADELAFFHELTLPPGEHAVSLRLVGETTGARLLLFDDRVTIGAGEVFQPPLSFDAAVPCLAGRACAQ